MFSRSGVVASAKSSTNENRTAEPRVDNFCCPYGGELIQDQLRTELTVATRL